MGLPRYEKDMTSQFDRCDECGKPSFDEKTKQATPLFNSPKSEHSQEVIGEDNKATKVAVPKVVCEACYQKDFKEVYPKAKATKLS